MKKMVFVVISLFLILTLLAGCGAKNVKNTTTEQLKEKSPKEEKVTLTLTFWNESQKEAMEKIVALFEKDHPNIKVNVLVTPWTQYWTKLQTGLPTGTGPEIFWLNALNAKIYIPAGLILDLQKYIDRDNVDTSVFSESIKDLYTVDGKLYAIPKDYDTIGLYYNKALFDKANVPYPTDSWTWDDLLDAAKKLTVKDSEGNIQQYGYIAIPNSQMSTYDYILQNNGQIFNEDGSKALVDSPEAIEAIQFLADMMFKHKVSPTGAEQQEINAHQMFLSEKAAMLAHGSWMVARYHETLGDKLAVAPLPMKKRRATVVHGLGFAASAKTKHPEEVWEFLKFLATKEAQELQAGVAIPAYKGAEQEFLDMYPSVNVKLFIDALEYGYPLPVSPKSPVVAGQIFDDEITNIWMGEKDVEDGLRDAKKRMDEELSKK